MYHCVSWSLFECILAAVPGLYSFLHTFQCSILICIYHLQRSLNRWKDTGFYSLKVESFILRCLHGNDYRCLSQLTHSSALGNMGILCNTIQFKSNVPANYRIYFPFFHTHLQLNHRFLFYSPLGIVRVSGKFNYLSGRYHCYIATHSALFFLSISQLPTLSSTAVRY